MMATMGTGLDETTLAHIPRRVENGWTVWSASNPNELTAVGGYLRYKSQHGFAFYRGESSLRGSMLATAFRPHADGSGHTGITKIQFNNHAVAMREYVDKLVGQSCGCNGGPFSFSKAHLCDEIVKQKTGSSAALVSGTYRAVVEPLLQHYGLKTRWLDVVDNIWVALWFACYRQVSVGKYAHHVRRSAAGARAGSHAYVIVFQTEPLEPTAVPGYRVGPNTRAVDLRYNVPSVYLRPHAQHGSLIAPNDVNGTPIGGLQDCVAGVVEVDLADALDWLGAGAMTSAGTLFPSASFDEGYRRLLDYAPAPSAFLGDITVYGPMV